METLKDTGHVEAAGSKRVISPQILVWMKCLLYLKGARIFTSSISRKHVVTLKKKKKKKAILACDINFCNNSHILIPVMTPEVGK